MVDVGSLNDCQRIILALKNRWLMLCQPGWALVLPGLNTARCWIWPKAGAQPAYGADCRADGPWRGFPEPLVAGAMTGQATNRVCVPWGEAGRTVSSCWRAR